MPDKTPLKKSAVVGEDGELIQPDTTVDPDAYAEYVETYVHRDPLLFRLREHVKDWGCAYIFAIMGLLFAFGLLANIIQAIMSIHSVEDFLFFIGVIAVFVGLVFAQKRYNNLK